MNLGDLEMALCLLLVIFAVFYLWDTPKKRPPVKEIPSVDIAHAIARSKRGAK